MNAQVPIPKPISRRDFVQTAAIATAVASGMRVLPLGQSSAAAQPIEALKPLIGFQADVGYVMQFGVVPFLDDIQARASVNTLVMRSHPFAPSWVGIDRAGNPEGNFAAAHPQYYQNLPMKPRALGLGDFDLPDAMGKIKAEIKKRGMRLVAWMQEDNAARPAIKGMDQLYEVGLDGTRTAGHSGGPCLNNPHFRALLAGQIEDCLKSYEVDGLQRGSERQGPLGNALGAWHHGAPSNPGKTSCFCEHCAAKASKMGIDIEKVKAGFKVLETYVRDGRAGKRPRDGYYVEFWRILLRHPELLTWETFWADSMREVQKEFVAKARSVRPGVEVGFHIWHNIAFNPIYRAEQDYRPYTEFADYIKPVVYDNPAGERMASFIESMSQNVFGDLSRQQALEFVYSVMGHQEKPFKELVGSTEAEYSAKLAPLGLNDTPAGTFALFSGEYVYRETKRAVEAVTGSKTRVCAGLGIDVVVKSSTPPKRPRLGRRRFPRRRDRNRDLDGPFKHAAGESQCGGGNAEGTEDFLNTSDASIDPDSQIVNCCLLPVDNSHIVKSGNEDHQGIDASPILVGEP